MLNKFSTPTTTVYCIVKFIHINYIDLKVATESKPQTNCLCPDSQKKKNSNRSLYYISDQFFISSCCVTGGCSVVDEVSDNPTYVPCLLFFVCMCVSRSHDLELDGPPISLRQSVCLSDFFPYCQSICLIGLSERFRQDEKWEVRMTGSKGGWNEHLRKKDTERSRKKYFFSVKRADVRLNWTRLLFSKDTMILPIMYKR